jgi:hypothetical protein
MQKSILIFLLGFGAMAVAETEVPLRAPSAVADQLPISQGLRKTAKDYGIPLKGLVSFRDPRNWWELSTTGPRRGVPLNKEISVILDYGGKSYWLLEHDSRNDSLLLGPISGNGIKDLALEETLQERLRSPRFYDHAHAWFVVEFCGCRGRPSRAESRPGGPAARSGDGPKISALSPPHVART